MKHENFVFWFFILTFANCVYCAVAFSLFFTVPALVALYFGFTLAIEIDYRNQLMHDIELMRALHEMQSLTWSEYELSEILRENIHVDWMKNGF